MKKTFCQPEDIRFKYADQISMEIKGGTSGYLQGCEERQLLHIAEEQDIIVSILHPFGSYTVQGDTLLVVYGKYMLPDKCVKQLLSAIDIYNGQPIEKNPDYGFRHLAEVALKALSPGINDPATAVLCLHALTDLFAYRLHHSLPPVIKNGKGKLRVIIKTSSFSDLFKKCIYPVWHYGKSDGSIQRALCDMLHQLKRLDTRQTQTHIFNRLENEVKAQMEKGDFA